MFRKVLVGTDLSEASDAVISCVSQLKPYGLQEVLLAHVVYVANTPGLEGLLMEEAAPNLERQKQRLEAEGLAVTTDMRVGVPVYTLSRLAEEHDVSAIIVGSHGKGLLRGMLLGSTSLSLLHTTTRAVLLIRIAICEDEGGKRCELACARLFTRILFPTDFSETAERAFHALEQIVREAKCPVTLMHVQDRSRIEPHLMHRLEEFNEIDLERLERMKARLMELGVPEVEIRLPFGSPASLILEEARNPGYSLIIMGSQGRGFIEEITFGSVANSVARLAPLPILFIPMPR